MSENPATNPNQSPKRVRITTPATLTTVNRNANRVKTPKALALACIQGQEMSLHPQVYNIIQTYGNKLIDLHHKLEQKKSQLNKMESNSDFIPRSARFNFEFYIRPEIQQTDEFNLIQLSTTDLIKSFQYSLKEKIMETMRLDINYMTNLLNTTVCEILFTTTKAFHLQHNPLIINPSALHTIAFLIHNFGDNLLKHFTLDKHSFKSKFTEVYHDTTIQNLFPSSNILSPPHVHNANNPNNPYARNLSQHNNNTENPEQLPIDISEASTFIEHLRQTLETTLVTSLDQYSGQIFTNKATTQLHAFSTEVLHEKATADTSARMDFSPSVTPQELNELIEKSTANAVSSLSREIQSLKAKLAATKTSQTQKQPKRSNSNRKNSPTRGRRGAPSPKKSSKNNTSRSKSPPSSNQRRSRSKQPRKTRQDAPDNDTSRNSKKKNEPNNKRNSVRKRSNSRSNSKRR